MTEEENLSPSTEPSVTLTPLASRHLESIRKWTLFFSILGFFFIGLMVVFAFSIGKIIPQFNEAMPGFPMLFGMIYVVFAIIYFFPVLYLYRFSGYTRDALRESSGDKLALALGNLKSHYAFIGYLTVALLIIYVFFFVIVLSMGLLFR